jgi:hypothetical protein|tara:strand:- start:15803 stop:15922 length:120 start_codon:yes stop_codon:yes gene_type:complete
MTLDLFEPDTLQHLVLGGSFDIFRSQYDTLGASASRKAP